MTLHKKLEIFDKQQINYELLKRQKLKKKTKQKKSRPIN